MRKHILRLSTRLSFTVLLLGLLCTFSFAHGNAQIRTSTDKAAQIANSTAYDYVKYATTNSEDLVFSEALESRTFFVVVR